MNDTANVPTTATAGISSNGIEANGHTPVTSPDIAPKSVPASKWKTTVPVKPTPESFLDLLEGRTPLLHEARFLSKELCSKLEAALEPVATRAESAESTGYGLNETELIDLLYRKSIGLLCSIWRPSTCSFTCSRGLGFSRTPNNHTWVLVTAQSDMRRLAVTVLISDVLVAGYADNSNTPHIWMRAARF